jgi:glucose/arabinose dehydrogenase
MIYRGNLFADWRGDAFVPGLSGQVIVRIELDGDHAREVERYDMGARIRSVVEGLDGAIWVLEDDEDDSTGRLLKLTPKH